MNKGNYITFWKYSFIGIFLGYLITYIVDRSEFNFFLFLLTFYILIPLNFGYLITFLLFKYIKNANKNRVLLIYSIATCISLVFLAIIDAIIK